MDALLVADALFAFAQSAEAREADLRERAAAAEAAACRERASSGRRAAALKEAEGLVAQVCIHGIISHSTRIFSIFELLCAPLSRSV